ncbi:MAG: hypothetical protein AMXMBFR22_32940 [Phycisphaerae bacterium]
MFEFEVSGVVRTVASKVGRAGIEKRFAGAIAKEHVVFTHTFGCRTRAVIDIDDWARPPAQVTTWNGPSTRAPAQPAGSLEKRPARGCNGEEAEYGAIEHQESAVNEALGILS